MLDYWYVDSYGKAQWEDPVEKVYFFFEVG
ncbi:hypothetical protein JOC34_004387 [Virgibacillus halotolerans]|nr:hypothetical protein [Virgibacillus halotolerans]